MVAAGDRDEGPTGAVWSDGAEIARGGAAGKRGGILLSLKALINPFRRSWFKSSPQSSPRPMSRPVSSPQASAPPSEASGLLRSLGRRTASGDARSPLGNAIGAGRKSLPGLETESISERMDGMANVGQTVLQRMIVEQMEKEKRLADALLS